MRAGGVELKAFKWALLVLLMGSLICPLFQQEPLVLESFTRLLYSVPLCCKVSVFTRFDPNEQKQVWRYKRKIY